KSQSCPNSQADYHANHADNHESSPSKKENNHRPANIELLLDGKRPEVANDPKNRPTFERNRHIYKIAPVPALFFYQRLELPTQWHNQREYYKEHDERSV